MSAASNTVPLGEHRDEWMTIEEAVETLGETRYMVMRRGLMGELVVRPIAGHPRVHRESVERVRASKVSR